MTTDASTLPASLSSLIHMLVAGFHLNPTRTSLAFLFDSSVFGTSVARQHAERRAAGAVLAAVGVVNVLMSEMCWFQDKTQRGVE